MDKLNRRLIKLFNSVQSEYQSSLISDDYKDNLKYNKTILSKGRQNRDIIYFNPPTGLTVSSKIGKLLN